MKFLYISIGVILFIIIQNICLCLLCLFMKRKTVINKGKNTADDFALTNEKGIKQIVRNCLSGYVIYCLKLLGRFPSNNLRVFLLKYVFQMDIGKNVVIHSDFNIRHPWNISIGSGTVIGDYAYLDGRKGIIIGCNVNISTGVSIWTMQHDVNDSYFQVNDKMGAVVIGDRAWLSCNSVILPNLSIGEGTVIAAGAVVTSSCDEFTVYGGIPAKPIASRNRELQYEFKKNESLWFV